MKWGAIAQIAGTALLAWAALITAQQQGCSLPIPPGPGPIPDPEPGPRPEPTPDELVESPFPVDGFYLLLASQADDKPPLQVVRNAQSVRNEPNLLSAWKDYDQRPEQPWGKALEWAQQKSGGQPYYVARHGNKASEGPLTGNAKEMLATVVEVIAELR